MLGPGALSSSRGGVDLAKEKERSGVARQEQRVLAAPADRLLRKATS
jgi:hypothetical protein